LETKYEFVLFETGFSEWRENSNPFSCVEDAKNHGQPDGHSPA